MNVAKVTSVKNRMSETIIIVKCLLNMKYILLAAKKENAVFITTSLSIVLLIFACFLCKTGFNLVNLD